MHKSILISTTAALALAVSASNSTSSRDQEDIRSLFIYPAQACVETITGFNPCDVSTHSKAPPSLATNNNSYVPCGDGTWCVNAACGHWAGKDKHCCSGLADSQLESLVYPAPEKLRLVCEPYRDLLADFDMKDNGEEPIKGSGKCQQKGFTENYPVALEAKDFLSIFDGTKKYDKCCSFGNDSLTLYTDAMETVETALCISPLGKGKELNMKEIEERDRKNAESGMSLGTTVIPSATFAALAFVGVAVLGML